MIISDEDSLICDFAETYKIYNYKEFSIEYIAILADGLRENSRIKLKLSGLEVGIDTLLLARICDSTTLNVYAKTKDAKSNRNRPPCMIDVVLKRNKKFKLLNFETGKDFLNEWRNINGN